MLPSRSPEFEPNDAEIKIIEEASEKFGLTWQVSYDVLPENIQYPAFLSGRHPLVPLILSHEGMRQHTVNFSNVQRPESIVLDHISAFNLAKASMAETDCIFSSTPPIFIPNLSDPYLEGMLFEYVQSYLNLFEHTSAVWGIDLLNQHYPVLANSLLIDRCYELSQRFSVLKAQRKLTKENIFQICNEAAIAKAALHRILRAKELPIETNIANVAYNQLWTLIDNALSNHRGGKNFINKIWGPTFKLYDELVDMPVDQIEAVKIMMQTTTDHSEIYPNLQASYYPIAIQNPSLDADHLKGHFWTITIPNLAASFKPNYPQGGSYLN